jgi:hypothetical protein
VKRDGEGHVGGHGLDTECLQEFDEIRIGLREDDEAGVDRDLASAIATKAVLAWPPTRSAFG